MRFQKCYEIFCQIIEKGCQHVLIDNWFSLYTLLSRILWGEHLFLESIDCKDTIKDFLMSISKVQYIQKLYGSNTKEMYENSKYNFKKWTRNITVNFIVV